MADETDNVVLEELQLILKEVNEMRAMLRAGMGADYEASRIGRLEQQLALFTQQNADHSIRLDKLDERLRKGLEHAALDHSQ